MSGTLDFLMFFCFNPVAFMLRLVKEMLSRTHRPFNVFTFPFCCIYGMLYLLYTPSIHFSSTYLVGKSVPFLTYVFEAEACFFLGRRHTSVRMPVVALMHVRSLSFSYTAVAGDWPWTPSHNRTETPRCACKTVLMHMECNVEELDRLFGWHLGLFLLISSHVTLFNLSSEHYSSL